MRLAGIEEVHSGLDSVLHARARAGTIDFNAMVYAVLRIPGCIRKVSRVVMGQQTKMFKEQGYTDIDSWRIVSARARRRFCLFDGKGTLACFITSRSDIDDLIPVLTAFQIEWNKLHRLMEDVGDERLSLISDASDPAIPILAAEMNLDADDFIRLCSIWGDAPRKCAFACWTARLSNMRVRQKNGWRMLSPSVPRYGTDRFISYPATRIVLPT